jgi:signal transduction histidine kinase
VAVTARRGILVLYSDQRLLPANLAFDASFRAVLETAERPADFASEFLDEVGFPAGHAERMRDLLRAKYEGRRRPDVVVAVAAASLDFCRRQRDELFPRVPIVFAGVEAGPGAGSSEPDITGVETRSEAAATLALALRLHPRVRQVYVIGAADGLGALPPGAVLHVLEPRPWPRLLQEVARLPDHSVVIDAAGRAEFASAGLPRHQVVERLALAARVPIYGTADFVGFGLTGAVATPVESIGRETAALVLEVLDRSPGAPLPAVRVLAAAPIVDWRWLQRWGIRGGQLPAGSTVRFEPLSFWRQHALLVITSSALFLLQSGLIVALVLQSRRRRRAEREALRRRQELAHMTRVATMGELTASLAHEINQPLAAILSNAQAGQRLLASGAAEMDEIRDILADIAADDQRAGEVIRRMRALLRKDDSHPTTVDLNGVVDEVVGLVRSEMILQNVVLVLDLASEPPLVHGDRIQLQQVLLNLVVNALDAMRETSDGNRRLLVRTAHQDGRGVKVAVEDSGTGVPDDKLASIFEPFVTTKPHGMGLGLPICRSIIQAHGGRIGGENNPAGGATFWFTLGVAAEVEP